ncbi:MAG: YoaK family protein [Bdellovibrionia bacterium]
MIQFNENSFRNRKHVFCWFGFAFQAGAINAGGFLACHSFVSHVTGIGTQIGIQLGLGEILAAIELLSVPFSFLAGAVVSALLIDRRQLLHKPPKYLTALVIISVLLGTALILGYYGLFGAFGEPFERGRDVILVSLLCAACGLQNASMVSATRGQIRTTHLTGTLTDFGVALIRVKYLRRFSKEKYRQVLVNRIRLGTLLFFSTGSALSSVICAKYEYMGFALPFLTSLLLLAVSYTMNSKRMIQDPRSLKSIFTRTRTELVQSRAAQPKPVKMETEN